MKIRDDIELTVLAETGRPDIAEDVGMIVQFWWDFMLDVIGVYDE